MVDKDSSVKVFLKKYIKPIIANTTVTERQISQVLQQYIEENTEEVLGDLVTSLENRDYNRVKNIFEKTNFYDYFLQEDTGSTELYYKIKDSTEQKSRGNCKWE